MNWTRNILLQILMVVGFMSIPFLFLAGEFISSGGKFYHNPYSWFTIFVYLGLLAFYYLNYLILIPRFYLKKRYKVYLAWLVFLLSVLIIVHFIPRLRQHHTAQSRHHRFENMRQSDDQLVKRWNNQRHSDRFPHRTHHHKSPPPIFQVSQHVFLFLLGLLGGLYLRTRKHLAMILSERNKAEISYLKSQINPHFLFNTFNSIYSLAIREGATQTANGMLKLSGMMRYVVSETDNDFVPLQKEIDYILNYIELHKLRLDKGVSFQFDLTGDAEGKKIAPLILIPFIENAFKHGVNPDEASDIRIRVFIGVHDLIMNVWNKKVSTEHYTDDHLGFGIENTKTRLKLLYPGNYELNIKDEDSFYETTLKLTQL